MSRTNAPAPSPERLRQLFAYQPDGTLIWLKQTSNRVNIGDVAGNINNRFGYRLIKADGSVQLAHRMVWALIHGEWPTQQIDHINMVRHDNRIENLRLASNGQNNANSGLRRSSTTGLKGVTWHKQAGKFAAQITHNGKHYGLGLFSDKNEAHVAYNKAAAELHGEFARAS